MNLLEFPLEIFGMIIHELVLTERPRKAWKYRLVCKNFADEIHEDIFGRQPAGSFCGSDHSIKQHLRVVKSMKLLGASKEKFDYFFLNQISRNLGADPTVRRKIQAMAHFFAAENEGDTEKVYQKYLAEVCNAVVQTQNGGHQGYDAFYLLKNGILLYRDSLEGYTERNHEALSIDEKVAAAAALNMTDIYRSLLPQSTRVLCGEWSRLYGNPVKTALSFSHPDIIKETIRYVRSLLPEVKSFVDANPGFFKFISEAMGVVIRKNGTATIVLDLISLYTLYKLPLKKDYDSWVYLAVMRGAIEHLNILLDVEVRSTLLLGIETLQAMCQLGDVQIIKKAIEKGFVNSKLKYSDGKAAGPLSLAIHSGSMEVVNTLLDAGIDINGPAPHEWLSSPLYTAIAERNPEIILFLLQDDAEIYENKDARYDRHYWDTMGTALETNVESIYEMVRKEKMRRTGKNVPTYSEARQQERWWVIPR